MITLLQWAALGARTQRKVIAPYEFCCVRNREEVQGKGGATDAPE